MRPAVTVLLRAGDGGAALLATADAVARQRGVAVEMAVIGSPEDALARSVAARHGATIVDPGKRPGAALNAAIRSTAAEYVAVIPGGFLPAPALLERAVAVLRRDESVAAVAPDVSVLAAGGMDAAVWGPPAVEASALLADPARTPPVFICRRSAWERAPFDERLGGLVDYEFWLRLALAGAVLLPLPGPLVARDAAAMTRSSVSDDEYLRQFRAVLDRHRDAAAAHMRTALVEREVGFGRTREVHRELLARRDADLAELDRLRAEAAHHLAYLEHHGESAVDWGDLRRLDPLSRDWGYDRGTPVDRRYIEDFLAAHSSDVRGAVLEIQESDFTQAFGGPRVDSADVLDVDGSNRNATVVADLRSAPGVPGASFDCIILTQTLHVLDDMAAALRECDRLLRPGGVLLATFPAASRVCLEYGRDGDFWRLTPAGARRLVEGGFGPAHMTCDVFGNVLTTTAFLHGFAAEELTAEEYDVVDPYFPALTGIRARKTSQPEPAAPRGVVLLYHRVGSGPDAHGLAIAAAEFERHLAYLRDRCTVLPLEELLQMPPEALPERPVALTFDDGYLDNLTTAAPQLSRAAMPATFFCTTRWLATPGEYWWDALERILDGGTAVPESLTIALAGTPGTLPTATAADRTVAMARLHEELVHATSAGRDRLVAVLFEWSGCRPADAARRPMLAAEVRELSRIPGMAIGAHTISHLSLPDQPSSVRLEEMIDSRAALEAITGRPVRCFAYPYGAVDRATAAAARRAMPWSLSCEAGSVADSFDAASIPRLDAGRLDALALAGALDRLFDLDPAGPATRLTYLPR